ncbi:hypothetical protein AXG93_1838s1070 [Marchantia polymorpha subsp. ruderalis]|uniref:Uncharacterized protein n=1 Tax=Marchantia polymorpha subsp. ruderalis TaxID=1480154 RepID=A0A176WFA2_MARPO|nr:hypothetical protein AXG93_1838s1070 [Marchantia polymorpha subsp. ruderalis]
MTKSRSRSSSRSRRSGKSGSQEAIVLYGMASRSLRVSGGAIWLAEQTITSSEAGDKCPGLYYKSVWQLVLHALARCPVRPVRKLLKSPFLVFLPACLPAFMVCQAPLPANEQTGPLCQRLSAL